MERMESRLRYPIRRCGGSYIPRYMLLPRRWLGYRRRDFVSLGHAPILRCFHGLSLPIGLERVEGTPAAVGPCPPFFGYNPPRFAPPAPRGGRGGGVGVGVVCLYFVLGPCGVWSWVF